MNNFLTKCALRRSLVLLSESTGLNYENVANQLEKTRLTLLFLDGVSIAEIEKFEEKVKAKSKEYEALEKDLLKIRECIKLASAALDQLNPFIL